MKIKPFFYILMVLALTISVVAVGSLNIVESSLSVTVNPGVADSSKSFTIQNTGGSSMNNIQVTASSFTDGTTTMPATAFSFSPSAPSVPALGNQNVVVTVTAPSNQKAATYTGSITATYDGSNYDYVPMYVAVSANPSFTLSADTLNIAQGGSGQLVITITNTGNSNLNSVSYTISSPFTKGTDTLPYSGGSSGTKSVAYGGSANITLTFIPSVSTPEGTYTGTITATYGSVVETLTLNVVVAPIVRDVDVVTENAVVVVNRLTSTIHSTTSGRINVTNTGNYAVNVVLGATGLTGPGGTIPSTSLSVSPSAYTLGVGGFASTPVGVSGVSPALTDGTYSGYFNVEYGGDTPEQAAFSVVIRSADTSISPDKIVYPESTRLVNVSTTATITNTGDLTLTGCTLTDNDDDTWITGTVPSTLAPDAGFTVTLKSYLDKNVDSGETEIAKLTFACTGFSKDISLRSNVESMLKIKSVKVSFNDGSWDSMDDGDLMDDDIYPGDTFEVKVKVENLFDEDEDDLEIERIEADAVFYNAGDDGDDIEGDIDGGDFDLNPEDVSDEFYIDWGDEGDNQIGWEVEEGELIMEIRVYGTDEEGADHEDTWQLRFNVERENGGDVRITRAAASPSSVRPGNSFMFYADGRSVGKNDDDVKLKITSDVLGISVSKTFEMGAYDGDECDALESDDPDEECIEFNYRESFKVPSDIGQGTYEIKVEVFVDNGGDKVDEQKVDITVMGDPVSTTSSSTSSTSSSTSSSSTTTSTSSATSTTQKKSIPTEGSSTTAGIDIMYSGTTGSTSQPGVYASGPTMIRDLTGAKQGGFRDSMGYLALLSVIGIIVVIAIVSLIAYVATRR